jgi:hypothetical protein
VGEWDFLFTLTEGAPLEMEICAVICSCRNVLAALSLPNKIYNSICSMEREDGGIE